MTIVRKGLRWLPLVLWMALIFYLSHQPKVALPDYGHWDLPVKKGAHLLVYALLALLARRAGLAPPVAFVLAVVYAGTDEWHQTFIPGRNGNLVDVFIDAVGAGLALVLLSLVHRRRVPPPAQPTQSVRRLEAGRPPPPDA